MYISDKLTAAEVEPTNVEPVTTEPTNVEPSIIATRELQTGMAVSKLTFKSVEMLNIIVVWLQSYMLVATPKERTGLFYILDSLKSNTITGVDARNIVRFLSARINHCSKVKDMLNDIIESNDVVTGESGELHLDNQVFTGRFIYQDNEDKIQLEYKVLRYNEATYKAMQYVKDLIIFKLSDYGTEYEMPVSTEVIN